MAAARMAEMNRTPAKGENLRIEAIAKILMRIQRADKPQARRRGYSLAVLRWRINLTADERKVSGIFLFIPNFFRSVGFSIGSIPKVTSSGALPLFKRLRITL